MNALDRKPPGPVITIHSHLPVLYLLSSAPDVAVQSGGMTSNSRQHLVHRDVGLHPKQGTCWQWELPISSPLPCAGQRGRRAAQGQAEGAWGARGRVLTIPTQLAAPRGKSACQPLLCCLLKSKYPRDSRMSMICTVFIQRDFATMQGNSYLIHLQPSDLILLIKCYC